MIDIRGDTGAVLGVGGLWWVRCALGEVVVFHEYRSTRDAGDRGGGCSTPYPASPSPRGVILHRYSARGGAGNLSAVNVNTPTEIPLLSPVHGYPVNRHALPAPCEGGGRRPRERPGGGGDPAREDFSDTQATGAAGVVNEYRSR